MKFRSLVPVCALASLQGPSWTEAAVKIGVLTDLSGPYADLSGKGSVIAAQMAVEDFRISHPDFRVDLIWAGHLNKPDVGAAAVRRSFEQEPSKTAGKCDLYKNRATIPADEAFRP